MLALSQLSNDGRLSGKTIFFTPAAAQFLKPRWPELAMSPKGEGSFEATAREFSAVVQNPKAWRALDRKWRFDSALLTGDPAGFRQLLEHLLHSPDWTFVRLDHTSLVFERSPARPWSPADLAVQDAAFKDHSAREQEEVRIQTAHRLIAIGELPTAKTLLEQVVNANANSAPAWTELAGYHAMQAQWDKALEAAGRALSASPDYLPGAVAKANALYATGKFSEALSLTRRLAVQAPEDGQLLSLHARVTHAAHAYQEEIQVLRKLVELSSAQAMPTGSWRIYLGQAYAADGQGEPALQQFEEALKDPELPENDRVFAKNALERIRSRKPIF